MSKVCSRCKEEKELPSFGKNKYNADGLQYYCKDCRRVDHLLHKTERNKKMNEAYRNNKEAYKRRAKDYYENNRELCIEQAKARAKRKSKEIQNYQKEYRVEHKEQIRKWRRCYEKERRRTDTEFRIKHTLRHRLWKILSDAKIGKSYSAFELLSCDIEALRQWLSYQFEPGMSWDNYGEWHIDHVRPCASFDLSDPEQQKQCFHWTNLQPLWAWDNRSKGAKYMGKVFGWKKQFSKGKAAELEFLTSYKGDKLSLHTDRAYDFNRDDGKRVELKSDFYPLESTKFFFIERYSVVEQEKPGSFWQSVDKADVFIYWFQKSGVYFEFDDIPAALAAVEQYILDKKPQPVYVQNRGYRGMGYRIPRAALAHLYKEVKLCTNS